MNERQARLLLAELAFFFQEHLKLDVALLVLYDDRLTSAVLFIVHGGLFELFLLVLQLLHALVAQGDTRFRQLAKPRQNGTKNLI